MGIENMYGKDLWNFFGGLYELSDLFRNRKSVGDYDINHEIYLMIEFLLRAYVGLICVDALNTLEDMMSDDSEDDLGDEKENMDGAVATD